VNRDTGDEMKVVEILVPCFNEEENLPKLFQEFENLITLDNSVHYHLLIVDNSSTDSSWTIIATYATKSDRVRAMRLSRNFGKENSLSAGLNYSVGDAVVPIDADLQDPMNVVPLLVEKWRSSKVDVVLAVRNRVQSRSWFREFLSRVYLKTFAHLSVMPIPPNTGEFRLLSKRFVIAFNRLPESERFVRGLFSWIGFENQIVYFDRAERKEGKSRFNIFSLLNLAIEGITSFSIKPLRLASVMGLLVSTTAIAYALYITVQTLINDNPAAGYSSLMVAILILSGTQLLAIGLIGEYVGRILLESKNRPNFIIRETIGIVE